MRIHFILIILILTAVFLFINNNINETFAPSDDDLEIIKFPFDCFIINLTETDEGRRRWTIISSKYPNAQHWKGCYGKEYDMEPEIANGVLTPDWDWGMWKHGQSKIIQMTPGELGVIISHYGLWKKIADGNEPVLILEDDAIKTDGSSQSRIDLIMSDLPSDFDIYLIGYLDLKPRPFNDSIHNRVDEFVLMHSYVVSPKGARKLLDSLPVNMPLDTWISSLSDKLKIYRHNFYSIGKQNRLSSLIISQKREAKQIENTNIT